MFAHFGGVTTRARNWIDAQIVVTHIEKKPVPSSLLASKHKYCQASKACRAVTYLLQATFRAHCGFWMQGVDEALAKRLQWGGTEATTLLAGQVAGGRTRPDRLQANRRWHA